VPRAQVLVMRRYPASLAAWRASLPADPAPQLRLYLRVFAAVLAAMQARRARRMFDDNQPLLWNKRMEYN